RRRFPFSVERRNFRLKAEATGRAGPAERGRNLVGAGGFEPPNTGSKVPRLTAWPRPSVTGPCMASGARRETLSVYGRGVQGQTFRRAIGRARRSGSLRVRGL